MSFDFRKNAGIIMDLGENGMYLADGNPCENEFKKYEA